MFVSSTNNTHFTTTSDILHIQRICFPLALVYHFKLVNMLSTPGMNVHLGWYQINGIGSLNIHGHVCVLFNFAWT